MTYDIDLDNFEDLMDNCFICENTLKHAPYYQKYSIEQFKEYTERCGGKDRAEAFAAIMIGHDNLDYWIEKLNSHYVSVQMMACENIVHLLGKKAFPVLFPLLSARYFLRGTIIPLLHELDAVLLKKLLEKTNSVKFLNHLPCSFLTCRIWKRKCAVRFWKCRLGKECEDCSEVRNAWKTVLIEPGSPPSKLN